MLKKIAGTDTNVKVTLADVGSEEGKHDLGCRAAPYKTAHKLQDEPVVDDQ